ncbi:Rz family phage spanin [Buttiauxella brennerae ATCC 51605]|uniref:Rz family phage spanin n=1 Tax=Buttiauxella brennerae ATCC 51605 TaxID=1354251 RepID=A0A1B7IQV7_9ENTR|nr:Rz-like lysis system protein LysB [Buttiauxella brennerae]OAT32115.1 Rz family phage spanin [Buttiauxella brennerae ATCC 51605]
MSRAISIGFVVALALSAFLGWRLDKSTDSLDKQAKTIGTLNSQLSDKNSQLLAVDLMGRANDALQLGLQQRNAQLAAGAAGRDQRFKELTHENAEVKNWADTLLPDAVIRLQQRPPITGSEGYHTYLSGSDALHSASQPTDD